MVFFCTTDQNGKQPGDNLGGASLVNTPDQWMILNNDCLALRILIELTTGLWTDILIYYNLSIKELHKTKASCISQFYMKMSYSSEKGNQVISAKYAFCQSMSLSINYILPFMLYLLTHSFWVAHISGHGLPSGPQPEESRQRQGWTEVHCLNCLGCSVCLSKYCFSMNFFSTPWRSPEFPGLLKVSLNDKLLPALRKFWGADTFSDVRMSGISGCCSEPFDIVTLPPQQWLLLLFLPDAELR